jgi:hypothetical protein
MENKKELTFKITLFLLSLLISGCSEYKDRKLVFSCTGIRYVHMTDDSFKTRGSELEVPSNTSLFVGDKTTEVFGSKSEICENGHTFIKFGNCEKRDLVNFYTFDLVSHKMFMYDYYSEEFRTKKNFPIHDESLRGEYQCKLVDNSKESRSQLSSTS